jgi:hypothetical protein
MCIQLYFLLRKIYPLRFLKEIFLDKGRHFKKQLSGFDQELQDSSSQSLPKKNAKKFIGASRPHLQKKESPRHQEDGTCAQNCRFKLEKFAKRTSHGKKKIITTFC